jgi:hypothetical protein
MLVMITIAGAALVVLALLFTLITVAIRAEDKHATATHGPPPNPLARAARRITGLHVNYTIPPDYSCQPTAGTSRTPGKRR